MQGGQGPVLERQIGEMLRGTQAVAAQLSQLLGSSPHPTMWSPVLESRCEALASNLSGMSTMVDELERVARQLLLEAAPELAGILQAGPEAHKVSATSPPHLQPDKHKGLPRSFNY